MLFEPTLKTKLLKKKNKKNSRSIVVFKQMAIKKGHFVNIIELFSILIILYSGISLKYCNY